MESPTPLDYEGPKRKEPKEPSGWLFWLLLLGGLAWVLKGFAINALTFP